MALDTAPVRVDEPGAPLDGSARGEPSLGAWMDDRRRHARHIGGMRLDCSG